MLVNKTWWQGKALGDEEGEVVGELDSFQHAAHICCIWAEF